MKRRNFLRCLPALILAPAALLAFPSLSEARVTSVASFLASFGPVYDENTEWDFGSGPLLTSINGHSGNLLVFIDDTWVSASVKNAVFDPTRQRLHLRLNDAGGPIVFSYNPLAHRIFP